VSAPEGDSAADLPQLADRLRAAQRKTGAVREVACAIALDPLAGLWIAELKGNRCSCIVGSSLCCSGGNVIVLAGRSSSELLAFCCSLR